MASLPELRLEDARESWFARTGEPAPERGAHRRGPRGVHRSAEPYRASLTFSTPPAPPPRAVGGLAVVGVLLTLALLTVTGVVVSGVFVSTLLARSTQTVAPSVAAEVAPDALAPAVVEPPPPADAPEEAAEPAPARRAPAEAEEPARERRGLFRRKNR